MPLIQKALASAVILVIAGGRISSAFIYNHYHPVDGDDNDDYDADHNLFNPLPRPLHIPHPPYLPYRHSYVGGNWINGHFYSTAPVAPPPPHPPPRIPPYVPGLGGYGTYGVGQEGYGGVWINGKLISLPPSGRIPGDVTSAYGGRIPGLSGLGRYATYGTPGYRDGTNSRPRVKLPRLLGNHIAGISGLGGLGAPRDLNGGKGKYGSFKLRKYKPKSDSRTSGLLKKGRGRYFGSVRAGFRPRRPANIRKKSKGRTSVKKPALKPSGGRASSGQLKKARGRPSSIQAQPVSQSSGDLTSGRKRPNGRRPGSKKPNAKSKPFGDTIDSAAIKPDKAPRQKGAKSTDKNVQTIPGKTSLGRIPGISTSKSAKYLSSGNFVLKPKQKPVGLSTSKVPGLSSVSQRVPSKPGKPKKPADNPKTTSKIPGIASDNDTEENGNEDGDESNNDDSDDDSAGNASMQARKFRWADDDTDEMDDDYEDRPPPRGTTVNNAGSGAYGAYAVGQGGMGGVNVNTATNGINAYNGGKIIMMSS